MFTHPQKTVVRFLPLLCACYLLIPACQISARRRHAPAIGGRSVAVVVDERLAALRDAPSLYAQLLQRLSRGRMVSVTGTRNVPGGLTFFRVMVTRRTGGWLQSEAVAWPARAGDDERLLRLIRASDDFERIARARIFLDQFVKSPLRPAVLMLYGEAAEDAAVKLSRDAVKRLDQREMAAGGAPVESYFMNYHGLDRYRKQGITFIFDAGAKQFHYDGASWREILRRYPRSPEANVARQRLDSLSAQTRR